jgi:hypothetical protein
MAKLRKLWSTTNGHNPITRRRHETRAAAYRSVHNDATNHAAGIARYATTQVWVDERDGRGWQLFERIDHAAERKA